MKKFVSIILATFLLVSTLTGCAGQSGTPATNSPVADSPTSSIGATSSTPPSANSSAAYAKLIAHRTDNYAEQSVANFNAALASTPDELTELLAAQADVVISPDDENYGFITVTLQASLSELYAEQVDEEAFFFGYVEKGRLSTPLNETEEAVFEEVGPIYDFLFTATYYLEYEIISPDRVTVAQRDQALRSLGEELQAYVDGLSEAELSSETIEKDLADRASTILQEITPDGMTISCEIQTG